MPMPISTANPRGRAANSGSKPRLGQARAADSWIPGERDMRSSPPFCMKGFDFILEFLPEMGDWVSLSQGCRGISAALQERAGRAAHPAAAAPLAAVAVLSPGRLTHRAILEIHRFGQEINPDGCLKRRKASAAATRLPASAHQIFPYDL